MKKNISLLSSSIVGIIVPFNTLYAQKETGEISSKPNIIYILTDDLGYGDLSCYGQTQFQTPNIDALAEQGMKFTNHYAGCSVSAPSRASLMTGLHTGHCPIRGNQNEKTPFGNFDTSLPASYTTIAECMKEGGYTTACVGKWGMGGPGTQGHPNKQGFDYFFGHLSQLNAHFYYPEYLWENETKIDLNKKVYSQDLFYEKATGFIKKNKDKPFFLYFAVTIPHAELIVPQEELNKFKGKYEEPKPWSAGQHYAGDHGGQPYPRAAFAAMINRLDGDIGKLRQLLIDLGIEENTLIIFTSDNGPHKEGGADPDFFHSANGFRGIKRDLYEGGIRMPMIAYWPRQIMPGSIANHPSAFWDFLPTACDIANVKIPKGLDGISFLPTLKGETQQIHPYFYWEFHEYGGTQAVRMGEWKGVKKKVIDNPDAPIELYYLNTDEGEKNNIAQQHPEIVKQIDKIMKDAHIKNNKFPFFKNEKNNK